jgi:hypothetical protein
VTGSFRDYIFGFLLTPGTCGYGESFCPWKKDQGQISRFIFVTMCVNRCVFINIPWQQWILFFCSKIII